jgi:hypothetical protein
MDRLQGTRIDELLSAYYDTVDRIALLEQSHAEYVRASRLELLRDRQPGLEPYVFSNPVALPPERFAELQPDYRRAIHSPFWESLIFTDGRLQTLVSLYDVLPTLAAALRSALEDGGLQTIASLPEPYLQSLNRGQGVPVLVEGGQVQHHLYFVGATSSDGEGVLAADSLLHGDNELQLKHHGGAQWVSFFFMVQGVDTVEAGRLGLDFSAFTTLELELKGAAGGEHLEIVVKDADYPDYLPPVSVPITLDGSWQRFEIDLGDFAPNDLRRLHIPLALNFTPADVAASVSVRSVRYR